MASLEFIKNKEDFICEKCGTHVSGSGYTNHCPECLWSKHVDVHPGDRQSACGGMMDPIAIEKKGNEYSILHKCIVCGFERWNKAVPQDNFDMLVQIAAERSKKFSEDQ